VRAVPLALPRHVETAGKGPGSRGAATGTARGAAPSPTAAPPSMAVASCRSKPRATTERSLRAGSDRAASGRADGASTGDQSAVSHEEGEASRSPRPPPPRPAALPPRRLRRTFGLSDEAVAPQRWLVGARGSAAPEGARGAREAGEPLLPRAPMHPSDAELPEQLAVEWRVADASSSSNYACR